MIELRPKNKEVFFLYHTSSSHSALSSLADFFEFLEVEGLAKKYFSMLGWSFDAIRNDPNNLIVFTYLQYAIILELESKDCMIVEGLAEKYFSMLGWFFLFFPLLSIFQQNLFIFFRKLINRKIFFSFFLFWDLAILIFLIFLVFSNLLWPFCKR